SRRREADRGRSLGETGYLAGEASASPVLAGGAPALPSGGGCPARPLHGVAALNHEGPRALGEQRSGQNRDEDGRGGGPHRLERWQGEALRRQEEQRPGGNGGGRDPSRAGECVGRQQSRVLS